MPATTGPSSCSTVLPILPRPSARSVPRCFWLWPIELRVWVIRTFATRRLLLLHGGPRGGTSSRFPVNGLPRSAVADRRLCRRRLVGKHFLHGFPPDLRDVLRTPE